jgi:hypothetical protein
LKSSKRNEIRIGLAFVKVNNLPRFVWRHRTNSLLKKSPTSSVVDGPPIFIKTIAVGPLELVAFCVTGGTGVANDLDWSVVLRCHSELVGVLVSLDIVDCEALFVNWVMGVRKDMMARLNYGVDRLEEEKSAIIIKPWPRLLEESDGACKLPDWSSKWHQYVQGSNEFVVILGV